MPAVVPTATIAQLKLALLVAESSAAAVGRKVGSTGNTIRLLAAGAANPKTTTVARFTALGIEPGDWFTAVAKDEPTLDTPVAKKGA
jgi:hypothetical protein